MEDQCHAKANKGYAGNYRPSYSPITWQLFLLTGFVSATHLSYSLITCNDFILKILTFAVMKENHSLQD